jgi:hypothetical protein
MLSYACFETWLPTSQQCTATYVQHAVHIIGELDRLDATEKCPERMEWITRAAGRFFLELIIRV